MNAVRTLDMSRLQGGVGETAVVVEEPLEVRLDGTPIAVTMRTPGQDAELAVGFLISEGVIRDLAALGSAASCADDPNVVEVRSVPGATGIVPPRPRSFFASSSCGVCGKAALDEVRVRAPDVRDDRTTLSSEILLALPERLREAQALFSATGSLHAAGLFSAQGERLCAREDIGRHNAVDKVIGWAAMRERLPLRGCVLLLSGRCGFELVQKALVAGVPIVASISGPSTLAVELAREAGMTLACFVRGRDLTLFSAPERIRP
jgi:FdhD protein